MNILAIRLRESRNAPWDTWKFSQGLGQGRRFLCMQGSPILLEKVQYAIDLVFSPHQTSAQAEARWPEFEASIRIADPDGKVWIIHRGDRNRIFRDGNELDPEQGQVEFFQSAAESSGRPSSGDNTTPQLAMSYAISMSDGKLMALPRHEKESERYKMGQRLARQMSETATAAATSLGAPELNSPRKLVAATKKLQPLFQQRQCVNALLKQTPVGQAPANAEVIEQLDQELELIRTIETQATQVLQPNNTPKVLLEQIKKVDRRIREHQSKCRTVLPKGKMSIKKWRQAVDLITKIEQAHLAAQTTRGQRTQVEHNIQPALEEYFGVIENLWQGDVPIVSELEECLSSMRLAMQQAPAEQLSQGQRRSWLEKFRSRDDQPEHTTEPQGFANDRLATTLLTFEYVLSRINQLKENVHEGRQACDDQWREFDDRYERLLMTVKNVQGRWRSFAESEGLPVNCDIEDLRSAIQAQLELDVMIAEKQRLTIEMNDLRQRILDLRESLSSWRQLSGSHKSADLKNSSIILAEARDVIRLKESRRAARAKAIASFGSESGSFLQQQSLSALQERLTGAWQKTLSEFGINQVEFAHANLQDIFAAAQQVQGLAVVLSQVRPTMECEAFNEADREDLVISSHSWDQGFEFSTDDRLSVIKTLETVEIGHDQIILIEDQQLADMLKAYGCRMASQIRPPAPQSQATDKQATAASKQNHPAQRAEPRRKSTLAPGPDPKPKPSSLADTSDPTAAALAALLGQSPKPSGQGRVVSQRAQQALATLTGQRKTN